MDDKDKSEVRKLILRVDDIQKMTGLSKPHLWRLEKSGDFPKKIRLCGRAVGWHEVEVLEWIENRPRV